MIGGTVSHKKGLRCSTGRRIEGRNIQKNMNRRISNVECRRNVFSLFYKKDRAQRFHPSIFCGSIFCGSAVRCLATRKFSQAFVCQTSMNQNRNTGHLTPRVKLDLDGTVNRLNVEHRTSNIERRIMMTLRFIYFKNCAPHLAMSQVEFRRLIPLCPAFIIN